MKFIVNGEGYELDIERLTFAEARAFESHSGVLFMEALENPNLRVGLDALQALVWIAVKRKEPTTKFSDLDDVEISSVVPDEEPEEDEAADPTLAAADALPPVAPAIAAVS